jgi:hypothetical protein
LKGGEDLGRRRPRDPEDGKNRPRRGPLHGRTISPSRQPVQEDPNLLSAKSTGGEGRRTYRDAELAARNRLGELLNPVVPRLDPLAVEEHDIVCAHAVDVRADLARQLLDEAIEVFVSIVVRVARK